MPIPFRCPSLQRLPILLGTLALALLAACGGSNNSAPSISSQPTSVTTVEGRKVKFSSGASGKPSPSLVWQFSTASSGSYTDITSQKTSTCKIADPKTSDAGYYRLYASNDYGSATSSAAQLTVLSVPALTAPCGVAVDSSSNLYVADSERHVVYRISSSGTQTLLAGQDGVAGTADGTGSAAYFHSPQGLALNGSDLYVTDYENHTIRKITNASTAVDASGCTVSTLAGTPGTSGSTDTTAGSPLFYHPTGLALANGYLYVADTGNHTIRRISTTSPYAVTTFAGTAGSPWSSTNPSPLLLSSPNGIAVDSTGVVYVADYGTSTIRKITADGLSVTVLAGYLGTTGTANGSGTDARFNQPVGITFYDSSTLLLADTGNHAIRRVSTAGVVTTLAGEREVSGNEDETGSAAHFNTPKGICVGSGYAFVADGENKLIRRVSSSGVVATLTSTGVVATSAYDD